MTKFNENSMLPLLTIFSIGSSDARLISSELVGSRDSSSTCDEVSGGVLASRFCRGKLKLEVDFNESEFKQGEMTGDLELADLCIDSTEKVGEAGDEWSERVGV